MKDIKKILKRGFNRLIFNTPIRSYKDPIEGLDYTVFVPNSRVIGISTTEWDCDVDLDSIEVTETDKDMYISMEYHILFHMDKDIQRDGNLPKKDEKELKSIFIHILMKQAQESINNEY